LKKVKFNSGEAQQLDVISGYQAVLLWFNPT